MSWWSAVICSQVDQIVVSVGPYMFHSSEPQSTSCFARPISSASPPQRIFRPSKPDHPVCSNMRHVAGVACMMVACCSSIRRDSAKPSAANLFGCNHDGGGSQQRAENLEYRNVETESRYSQQAIFFPDAGFKQHAVKEVNSRAMLNRYAFRLTGRARGVNDVGQLLRVDIHCRLRIRLLTDSRPVIRVIQTDSLDIQAISNADLVCCGNDNRRSRVPRACSSADSGGKSRVQRHVTAA